MTKLVWWCPHSDWKVCLSIPLKAFETNYFGCESNLSFSLSKWSSNFFSLITLVSELIKHTYKKKKIIATNTFTQDCNGSWTCCFYFRKKHIKFSQTNFFPPYSWQEINLHFSQLFLAFLSQVYNSDINFRMDIM